MKAVQCPAPVPLFVAQRAEDVIKGTLLLRFERSYTHLDVVMKYSISEGGNAMEPCEAMSFPICMGALPLAPIPVQPGHAPD